MESSQIFDNFISETVSDLSAFFERQQSEIRSMLRSFFENAQVGMTKEHYFEVCEAVGSQPIESEIPIEYDDLPIDIQLALDVYYKLRDEWDYMNGNYIGKSFNGFKDILDILEVPLDDRKTILEYINVVDGIRKIFSLKVSRKQNQISKNQKAAW